jgi:hypothetical protein
MTGEAARPRTRRAAYGSRIARSAADECTVRATPNRYTVRATPNRYQRWAPLTTCVPLHGGQPSIRNRVEIGAWAYEGGLVGWILIQ